MHIILLLINHILFNKWFIPYKFLMQSIKYNIFNLINKHSLYNQTYIYIHIYIYIVRRLNR